MVILGLGSNIGDRLAYLRDALHAIKNIPDLAVQQVSPVYESDALLLDDAPTQWDAPFLNLAIRCHTTLTPYELLKFCKEIELNIGRKEGKRWGPRVIDIDILAWNDLIIKDAKLHIPHEHLPARPFALWPLADLAPRWVYPEPGPLQGKTAAELVASWGSRFTGSAPLHTRQILQRIDAPQVVGIINVSPDSFSDGGKFHDLTHAIQHAHLLTECGAEILDIGAEASGPNAKPIDTDTEWQRLEPVLTALLAEKGNMRITPKISVDTRHVDVAKKALLLGADWINDVSGLSDSAMCGLLAESNCDIVMMHQLGIPASAEHVLAAKTNPVEEVYAWAIERLATVTQLGIQRERIIFDIGIGFGKTAEQSLELLQHIDRFQQLGVRLLVGHSRKSFLKLFTNQSAAERDIETLATSLFLSQYHVNYIRLHNVEIFTRALKVAKRLGLT